MKIESLFFGLTICMLLSGCIIQSDYERYMSTAKRPVIVVAKCNGGTRDYPTTTIRDSLNNTIYLNYEVARQINSCYKVGDTIK